MTMPRTIMALAVLEGDCFDVMAGMDGACVDSVVTDPPYGLGKEPDALEMLRAWVDGGHYDTPSRSGFMGKEWDAFVPQPAVWKEVYRVLKPGGYVACFFGTRTYDLGVLAMRLAGFEVRDLIGWLTGQGFPKSLNVGRALDERTDEQIEAGVPPSAEVMAWQGWGTALKPAIEPIVLARKPLSEGTVAANVLRWATGAINVDGCRVGTESTRRANHGGTGDPTRWRTGNGGDFASGSDAGRWPANIVHDGSDEVVGAFPSARSSKHAKVSVAAGESPVYKLGLKGRAVPGQNTYSDSGSAARFFYSAKASKADRAGSKHPTVKPVALMQWLARLVTPPGGTILDPFAGSGTTGAAAVAEGFGAILIEREPEYVADIRRRVAQLDGPLFAGEAA